MPLQHTDKSFDEDMERVRTIVVAMGGLVEKQFTRALDAVRYGDLRLAALVLAEEAMVNQMQVQADLLCNQVIARRQPAAIDLRELIGAIHTIHDLERIGDEAKKIALRSKGIETYSDRASLPLERVATMAENARGMLGRALDAMIRHDASLAATVPDLDLEVDSERDSLQTNLLARMGTDAGAIAAALDLMFVVQSIERIGDHAKNLAEYVIHIVEGVDTRHTRNGSDGPR
ncbi:MAG: phosphate transport system regulatory protein PhoU [Betaproteobacteria bacterium]|jgi:phosphate transport system protein|nr:phosphate transport system regulatory protein PhoU [Betaproteobacteria bacterium]NBY16953.1 phosphate transport system regulatory protein PhoU [Betaproteobacteria bacterium]